MTAAVSRPAPASAHPPWYRCLFKMACAEVLARSKFPLYNLHSGSLDSSSSRDDFKIKDLFLHSLLTQGSTKELDL